MQFIDEKINDYSINKSSLPSSFCDELEQYTRAHVKMPQMLVGKLEASFLGFIIQMTEAKKVLEIGTFTGYSALAMAENLPADGSVTTLDINSETSEIAHQFWQKAPDGYKISQVLAPALESLENLNQQFDLIFIDADKENYLNYLQKCLPLLSSNGVIVVDNVLWSGKVLNESSDIQTQGIQRLNNYVKDIPSLYSTLLPIRDGMLLIQRKKNG